MILCFFLNMSNIISGFITGIISSIIASSIISYRIKIVNRQKELLPEIKVADKLSLDKDDGFLRIKFLNMVDVPISIKSSWFILSYRKDAKELRGNNYRHSLPIPGEPIPYIYPQNKDTKDGQRNEKTYASIVIDPQLIDSRAIENSNVSQTIQKKYRKYKADVTNNTNDGGSLPCRLSINDFFEEDKETTITAILEVLNLENQKTKTVTFSFTKDKIAPFRYQVGRNLDISEPE